MGGRGRLATLVALIVAVLLSVSGCQKSADTPRYHIALGPQVGFGPLYLARDKGFFKEQGVEAELIVLAGVAKRNSALKSGKLDALAAPVDYFALSAGNGVPATIVMAQTSRLGGGGDGKARDNCVFEAGLFFATLGPDRCFLVNDVRNIDLPSDLGGVVSLPFKEPLEA